MAMQFFTDSGRGFNPKVSIRKQGQIGFNQGAVRRFLDKDKQQYGVLGYDPEEAVVGIKITEDAGEPGARPIMVKNGSASISARSFLDFFAIPYSAGTLKFNLAEKGGILVFSIPKPM